MPFWFFIALFGLFELATFMVLANRYETASEIPLLYPP